MYLDATNKSITVKLGEAHTTTALDVTGWYEDLTTTTFLAGSADISSNGVTPVTAVAAPAASTQRRVKRVVVYNADTVSHTVFFQLLNNVTTRILAKVTINPGESCEYS